MLLLQDQLGPESQQDLEARSLRTSGAHYHCPRTVTGGGCFSISTCPKASPEVAGGWNEGLVSAWESIELFLPQRGFREGTTATPKVPKSPTSASGT